MADLEIWVWGPCRDVIAIGVSCLISQRSAVFVAELILMNIKIFIGLNKSDEISTVVGIILKHSILKLYFRTLRARCCIIIQELSYRKRIARQLHKH